MDSTYQVLQRQVFIMSLSYQFPSGLRCGIAFVLVLGFEELGVLDSKHLLRPQNALLYRK